MTRWARVTWQVPDPATFAPALATRLGTTAAEGGGLGPGSWTVDLGSAWLEIRPWLRESPQDDPLPGGRLVLEPVPGGEPTPEETEVADDDPADAAPRPLRLVGLGWATVELDRAADELGMWLGEPADPGAPDAADPLIGARARVYGAGGLPGDAVLLLEPSTEGRLAASLVRDGEGAAALYLRPTGGLRAWATAARSRGVTLSARRIGPLGSSVLVAGGPRRGAAPRDRGHARRPCLADARRGYHRAMNDVAQLTIRPAAEDDAERLAALLTDEGYPAGPSDLGRRIRGFTAPATRVLVAEQAGEVLGFIAFALVPRFETEDRFIRVVTLIVDPGARERGDREGAAVATSSGSVARRASRSSRSRRGTIGPTRASCSSPLGYDASVTAYLRKRP